MPLHVTDHCYQCLRRLSLFICVIGWVLNSYETFQKFIDNTTLVLSSTQVA